MFRTARYLISTLEELSQWWKYPVEKHSTFWSLALLSDFAKEYILHSEAATESRRFVILGRAWLCRLPYSAKHVLKPKITKPNERSLSHASVVSFRWFVFLFWVLCHNINLLLFPVSLLLLPFFIKMLLLM